MTANELQRFARHLSNQVWTRHWLNYGDRHQNVRMAIQCIDAAGAPVQIRELPGKGFTEEPRHMYTVARTNDDGSPFISQLF